MKALENTQTDAFWKRHHVAESWVWFYWTHQWNPKAFSEGT